MTYTDRAKQLGAMREWGRDNPRTAYKRDWRHRNPDKVRAARQRGAIKKAVHKRVERAIERGDLIPEPCLFCGDTDVVAHHHDYSLPFAVTWLCRLHHALVHRSILV